MLREDWKQVADKIAEAEPEGATTELAQWTLEEVWEGDDPDAAEITLGFEEIKRYLIEVWACNPAT